MDYRNIIKALGGPSEVEKLLTQQSGMRVSAKQISNWPLRGIPIVFRPAIAAILADVGLPIPENFFPGIQFSVECGKVYLTSTHHEVTDTTDCDVRCDDAASETQGEAGDL